jgi:1,5-anhydro-D-fructose reductase (1,5-anhydro-D-mannitol-forming)
MSATRPVAMAVVGSSGHAARVSAPTIAAADEAQLVGVLGSTTERGRSLAERHPGCQAYADLDELCADPNVEAVWIAGPNDRHVEHATRCLVAGKHVLLEKPMATTLAGAERLLELSRGVQPTLTVGFQHRFRPAHRWLREAVGGGLLGDVGLMRIHRFWPFPYFPGMDDDPATSWRSSLQQSGGWALNDIGSHLIDLAQWLIDVPARLVFARTANVKFRQAGAEDTAVLVLGAGSDATLTIETSNAMSSFPGTIEIHGTAGWVRAEGTFDGGGTILTHAGDRHAFGDITTAEVYAQALVDFLGAVHGLPTIGATPRQAADTVAIVEAAVRGHRSAGWEANPT